MFANILNIYRRMVHVKCRNSLYPRSRDVNRFNVPDEKVDWTINWEDYKPFNYTAKCVIEAEWADPELNAPSFSPNWNSLDGKVNRKSFLGLYEIIEGAPRNPNGRTGIIGRGCLGRWGPNHAADPIVTRWKRDCDHKKMKNLVSGKPIMQFVAIERRDCNLWAIPGGMVDPGELVTNTLRREFLEEALNSLEKKENIAECITNFLKDGIEIYKGYVDDPRNTDNSWMETCAFNFHDEDGSLVGSLPLEAGDDAKNITWMDLDKEIELYASHRSILQKVIEFHRAHW